MTFRILDHLLIGHDWTAAGCLVVSDVVAHAAAAHQPERASTAEQCADLERRSLLARLAYRGKQDRILARAARRLRADPSLSLQQLAAELGVSEGSLSRGLRGALGEGVQQLFG
jgi:hypothetical protein